ncbi:MAG TPA: branched-chain amino acid ABC transporter permease [Mycobacteriales bacterium]|jgi:branched-chain amino acid transport system permease protein|nr:branched-chain amino acid ABC transporter permease [Mycobacteriales bacterium]
MTSPAADRRIRLSEGAKGRLVGWLSIVLVLALISGPGGSSSALSYGFRHSILRPRVIPFVVVGVVAWALLEVLRPRREWVRSAVLSRFDVVRQRVGTVPRNRLTRSALPVAALVVAVVIPPFLNGYWQTVLVQEMGIFTLLALGLNVVVGFAGLLDLGYIAFFAVGGYTTAYFTGRLPVHPPFTLNPFWILPIAILAALIAGVILGAPTLRLRGDYLAIVTLGFGEIVFSFARNKTDITNGDSGAFNIPHFSIHTAGIHYTWSGKQLPYYWVLVVFVVLIMFLFRRLENSRVGRAWTAIREDEVAAAASGVPTVRYKLLAFAIGASTSGFAGVLYAANVGFITDTNFVLQQSILVLVLVIFGGMGSMWGVLAGAAFLEWLPEKLRGSVPPSDRFIYFGLLIILMMIFRPQGMIPSRRRALEIKQAEAGVGEADALGLPKETQ